MTTTTTTTVTASQIDACSRVIDNTHHEIFYLVQSASQPVEYKVSYNRQYHVLQCTCKAGSEGRACWHKNAVVEAEKEYQTECRINRDADTQEAMEARSAEEIAAESDIERWVRQGVDRETATRVASAKPAKSQGKGHLGYFANTGFSLLK